MYILLKALHFLLAVHSLAYFLYRVFQQWIFEIMSEL